MLNGNELVGGGGVEDGKVREARGRHLLAKTAVRHSASEVALRSWWVGSCWLSQPAHAAVKACLTRATLTRNERICQERRTGCAQR